MINLNPEQEDALIEIGNIGMSKAAKQLSLLLNSTIKISIPKISLINVEEIKNDHDFKNEDILSYVSQILSQDLDGVAALVFQREQTTLLTISIFGETPQLTKEEVRACEQEAMLEIGNIIISSCISVIANMLSKQVTLTLPVYDEHDIISLLKSLCSPIAKLNNRIIAISTRLDTSNDRLSGSLFVVLTEESIEILLKSIKDLING